MSKLLEDPFAIFDRACEEAEILERTGRGGGGGGCGESNLVALLTLSTIPKVTTSSLGDILVGGEGETVLTD